MQKCKINHKQRDFLKLKNTEKVLFLHLKKKMKKQNFLILIF